MVHYYLDGEDFTAEVLTDEEMEDAIEDFEDDYYDGQPDEYTEWQDFMGGDDWDHGQYDEF